MITKTDIELKIVDSVDTSHSDVEVLADSASNPDAFYVGRGYLAKGGEKVIESIDEKGTYPNVTVGNAQKAKKAEKATHADTATDLSGRVEATPEVFTFRPSAGDKSIKDDNAFIRRVKGNSVVWNQFIAQYYRTNNGVTISFENGIYNLSGTASDSYFQIAYITDIPKGHLFLIFCEVLANPNNISFMFGDLNNSGSRFDPAQNNCVIYTVSEDTLANHAIGFLSFPAGADFTGVKIACNVHDLTAMFGTGNEPTTVDEFRALYPNSYYPYNAGELRNLVCSGIKTVGFNLVDKNNFLTGVIAGSSDTPSQKSDYRYIKVPVFPNTEYYLKDVSNLYYYYSYILYDSNMNRIKAGGLVVRDDYPYNASFVTTTPSNAAYMLINVHKDFVDTCCVNLHHTGYRDGEYEPYKEVTHALPLSKITNGEPLRKAGEVYDEINETEYIRRVGVVDLGSLGWSVNDASKNVFWSNSLDGAKLFGYSAQPNLTCVIDVLPFGEINSGIEKFSITMHNAQKRIVVCAPNFEATEAGTASLKASLSGVLLQYELAEPIVKPIETPIDFNYYVEDFGTEEAILAENSAPFSADIIYQFNATDNIRQNRTSILKLNNIFSGSKGEYVRADGSWGYIADLKGNFFVKPTLKRIRTGISELSDTIQIIHPYLTEHIGDAKIVLMAVKRRGGTYYDRATNAKGRRKKRKAWGELHYAAMPNREMSHNTIEMPNGASFEAWQSVILTACGRIPEGLENAREPYNVNVASEDLTDFFATNGAIFVGKTPVIRLGVALRIPNPNFIDYGNGNKMWDYNDVTGKWEYKYLYSDVAEVVVKSQMLSTGGYVLGLELV